MLLTWQLASVGEIISETSPIARNPRLQSIRNPEEE